MASRQLFSQNHSEDRHSDSVPVAGGSSRGSCTGCRRRGGRLGLSVRQPCTSLPGPPKEKGGTEGENLPKPKHCVTPPNGHTPRTSLVSTITKKVPVGRRVNNPAKFWAVAGSAPQGWGLQAQRGRLSQAPLLWSQGLCPGALRGRQLFRSPKPQTGESGEGLSQKGPTSEAGTSRVQILQLQTTKT